MGPVETVSSPAFPVLDPIVIDDEMDNPYRDTDMDFLDPSRLQMATDAAGQEFDDLFSRAPGSRAMANGDSTSLSLAELSRKRHYQEPDSLNQPHTVASDSSADSPGTSSHSSSSESPRNHLRHTSVASTNSAVYSDHTMIPSEFPSADWMNNGLLSMRGDPLFGLDASLPALDGGFAMDTDLESSNRAMDAAFDFESAASSPSPLKSETTPQPQMRKRVKAQMRSPSNPTRQSASPLPPAAQSFAACGFREISPFSIAGPLGQAKSASSQWGGQSPSSVLEDFGGIDVNGGSPMNPALSPGLNFGANRLAFGMNLAPSPPQTTLKTENPHRYMLTVHPTSLKSRVETQIPIRLTLFPLPKGAKRLRLPTHTISKPKFLAPIDTARSPETLELYTSLVCTSAMQDQDKLKKAFARARGETNHRSSSSSPKIDEDSQQPEEDKPLDGGEVKICNGCIQRERKRASRKKQRKPEEDELFQKDEDKRVIVFNTNEIKDWAEPSKNAVPSYNDTPAPIVPPGAVQVELPMRIACYCRHQNEKLGFQVIFTVKDYEDNVIAQAITNSIMITDDHKTHAPPAPPVPGPTPALPDGTHLPGVGVFASGPTVDVSKTPSINSQQSFRLSHSTTDLQGLQQRLSPQYPHSSGAFAVPQNSVNGVSNSQTPRSLSRQASPVEFQGPSSKRRKHSNSGRVPSELAMTKLDTLNGSSASPTLNGTSHNNNTNSNNNNNTTNNNNNNNNNAQFHPTRGFASPIERPFVTSSAMSGQYANGPPTPNGNDTTPFFNPSAQHQTLDTIVQQQLMSAPNSAQPSRPGTPGGSNRNGFQDQGLGIPLGPNTTSQMWPPLPVTGNRLPSVIHKLVPAEGSITGGTEVTLLGSGFYPGMEVVFGDTLATTTTFWGDKCLNCLTPPALQPGLVSVVFKHEHPTFGPIQQSQPILPKQQLFFRYVDDRELQMYRLALGILGHKLGNQADAFQTAQQIMGGDTNSMFNLQKDYQSGSGGHQRQVPGLDLQGKMSDLDSKMLTYLEFVDLDDSPRAPKYNSRCTTGQTLLHFASSLGLTRFVAGLLARGASPDVQDSNGNTPMHLAALSGHAHIVHRLRLAGAGANDRSIRGFTPADLATSLAAHQAALIPSRHYRSRSVGSLSSSGRRYSSSSASLSSQWEVSSVAGSVNAVTDDSDELDEESTDAESESPVYLSTSRRPSISQDAAAVAAPPRRFPLSRANSIPAVQTPVEQTAPPPEEDARPFSPPAALVAWRNQLAAQINQFQQSVSNAFPHLPNLPQLPPMPALPDYQAHPMMRRITNLVPHRPNAAGLGKEGWWDLLTGSNSAPNPNQPPSYEELYPHNEGNEADEAAIRSKKVSLLQAATEAVVDMHFEAQAGSSSSSPAAAAAVTTAPTLTPVPEELKDIRIGKKSISREQQKQLREQHARRMKGLGNDRNLYFIWIPLLLLVLGAWMRNFVPGIGRGLSDMYQSIMSGSTQQALDVST
ncbi:hypothetical protein ASPZODRAFT_149327 [Penicilliopsis zonata CBS 506.65]|uniref:Uncharacterized protein n=1 Tax=Penicilliopsis zonata CBS 506.65 TaxID=1073090 RepID=A0A1L9SRR9_9EURO|nr:hypothetical protein ASPZODRAFT_149327 [Penicilliopsis zonata CBS 506.65]OJJ49868.1 hypothetical protein ASPZODRAFT_149327 [Penicilliopsis zonata CBS 506.65]